MNLFKNPAVWVSFVLTVAIAWQHREIGKARSDLRDLGDEVETLRIDLEDGISRSGKIEKLLRDSAEVEASNMESLKSALAKLANASARNRDDIQTVSTEVDVINERLEPLDRKLARYRAGQALLDKDTPEQRAENIRKGKALMEEFERTGKMDSLRK